MRKVCTKCGKNKKVSKFYSNGECLRSECKKCILALRVDYSHTKEGVVTTLYAHQRASSRERSHPVPAYSRLDLQDWLFAQKKFHHLFHLWGISNFDKMLKPSVDRINDDEPYNMSNIQLMTWAENKAKGHTTTGKRKQKAVVQYDCDMVIVNTYSSARAAYKETDIHYNNISSVCLGKRRTAGGFMWRFK